MNYDELNRLSKIILDACLVVHRELGPGLLESIYTHCLKSELESRGVVVQCKIPMPLVYRGAALDKYFELDMLIENEIIIEAKAVETMHPVYEAQIISYLKLSDKKLGFLVNFNVSRMKDGFSHFVNNWQD